MMITTEQADAIIQAVTQQLLAVAAGGDATEQYQTTVLEVQQIVNGIVYG